MVKNFILSTLVADVLFTFFFLPIIFAMLFEWHQGIFLVVLVAFYLLTAAFLVFVYKKEHTKFSVYALPLSFVLLPVLIYYILAGCRLFINVQSCPAGWEILSVVVGIYYSFPFFVITLVFAVIKWRRKKNAQ